MGRYEDMNVIEIENPEDIVSIFEAAVYDFEDTIALVSDRELIAYTLHDIIKNDSMNISYVDLPDDYDEGVEYFIKVDKDGNITCGELDDWYCINDVNVAYIDMDGTVNQDVIDYCINEDMDVTLWGIKDEPVAKSDLDKKWDKLLELSDGTKVHVRNYYTEDDIKEINDNLDLMDLIDMMSAIRKLDRLFDFQNE